MKKLILSSLVVILMGIAVPYAHAQKIAEQPCDADYWRQMEARAWLEAEREIMQNQNLIFKADSVLEYTCFDQFLNLAAWPGGDIFTHTDYFGTVIIPRGTSDALEQTLSKVVYKALVEYRDNNFQHEFLGGRAEFMDIANKNSEFQSPTGKISGYTCKTMSDVWKAAKCANFIDNEEFQDTDGFYPFEDIKGLDSPDVGGYADTIIETRQFPGYMACSGSDQGAAGTWRKQIDLAENVEQKYLFQTPLGEIFKDVGDQLKPGNCDNKPIQTGIVVITKDGSHMDGVCTNPGCTYTKSGSCDGTGTDPGP